MSKTITVDQLLKLCQEAKRKGHGKKKILISTDDEGNGYHELFFGFTDCVAFFGDEKNLASPSLPFGVTKDKAMKEYITLG